MVLMMREGFVIIKTLPRPRKTLRRGLTLGGRERSEEDVCFRSLQKNENHVECIRAQILLSKRVERTL